MGFQLRRSKPQAGGHVGGRDRRFRSVPALPAGAGSDERAPLLDDGGSNSSHALREASGDSTRGWEGILKGGVYHLHKELGVNESVMWGDYLLRGSAGFRRSGRCSKGGRPTIRCPRSIRLAFALCWLRRDVVGGVVPRISDSFVPMISPETTSSTRRFCWRPAAVSFDATGCVSPKPLAVRISASDPVQTR